MRLAHNVRSTGRKLARAADADCAPMTANEKEVLDASSCPTAGSESDCEPMTVDDQKRTTGLEPATFSLGNGFLKLAKKQGDPLYKALYEQIASLQTVARRRVFMRTIAVQVEKNGTNGTHSQAFCGR